MPILSFVYAVFDKINYTRHLGISSAEVLVQACNYALRRNADLRSCSSTNASIPLGR